MINWYLSRKKLCEYNLQCCLQGSMISTVRNHNLAIYHGLLYQSPCKQYWANQFKQHHSLCEERKCLIIEKKKQKKRIYLQLPLIFIWSPQEILSVFNYCSSHLFCVTCSQVSFIKSFLHLLNTLVQSHIFIILEIGHCINIFSNSLIKHRVFAFGLHVMLGEKSHIWWCIVDIFHVVTFTSFCILMTAGISLSITDSETESKVSLRLENRCSILPPFCICKPLPYSSEQIIL